MIRSPSAALALVTLAGCASLPPDQRVTGAPFLDAHQHLVSPAFAPIVKLPERDGAALVREMDAAGVRRAIVLSVGYSLADERKALPDPDGLTRAENDWTSVQVSAHLGRLIGFCSANPQREAALGELARCLALPGMTGIKLHFGNSGISLRDAAQRARIGAIAQLAGRERAPILVHMRARGGANFGPEDAALFLREIVPQAGGVDVIVAHLGLAGPGYPPENDAIMAEFARLLRDNPPALRRVWFDVATNVTEGATPADGALVAQRLREVGIGRVLYGSDLSPPGGSIANGWEIFRTKVPLTAAEFARIARNAPDFAKVR